jgi:hypothetical protein
MQTALPWAAVALPPWVVFPFLPSGTHRCWQLLLVNLHGGLMPKEKRTTTKKRHSFPVLFFFLEKRFTEKTFWLSLTVIGVDGKRSTLVALQG